MNDSTHILELEAEIRAYLRTIAASVDTIQRLRRERDDAVVRYEECAEQVTWTTGRCNEAMGEGFQGTPASSVAAVCDTLKLYREVLLSIAGSPEDLAALITKHRRTP